MMSDLNSVLIEGTLMESKGKRDHSGVWLLIRSKVRGPIQDTKTTFRVNLPASLNQRVGTNLTQGVKLRVVGKLQKESRMGMFVTAEHLEVRPMPEKAQ